ncbi:MAG: hypothetical protein JW839_20890 [Candidatus Lokiarchaeota archaeon]|nr:hypothetical protein [Candidatus Lokiarchaeota archaeon]
MAEGTAPTSTSLMQWEDINDIIEDLQEAIDEIDVKHPSLHAFKAAIVRAIAGLRAERACLEASLPSRARTTHGTAPARGDPARNAPRRLASAHPGGSRVQYLTWIANERLREDIKSIL